MRMKFADNIHKYGKENTQARESFFGVPVVTTGTVYKKEASTWQQSWQRTSAEIVRIDR